MASTFTTNKGIEKPASGSYNNSWATPVNADWDDIDTCFGGTTLINVTGVSGPAVNLTLSQYQPPNIIFQGVLSANLTYAFTAGIGGIWTIENDTTGAFTLSIKSGAGEVQQVPQNQRALLVSSNGNVEFADTAPAIAAQAAAETFATSAANTAQSNAEAVAANANNLTSGTVALARLPSLPASQITSGTLANARLPNVFAGPGVTIASDPGTTPTGTFGQVFAYY